MFVIDTIGRQRATLQRALVDAARTDRATLLCIVALALFPIVVFVINRSYIYTYPGDLDAWVYAGYHVHFPDMWHYSPWAYYGTRVPYTALGYMIYRLFGAEPSLYILAVLQFYVATFSLLYTMRVLFQSPVAGLLAACLLGTNSWFLWAIGWKYIDGPSIACILFSFAALTAASRQKQWRAATLVWGATMAATTALYLMYVVLLPVEIVAFIVLNWFGSRRPILPTILLLLAGFAGNLLLMGLVNWGLGGSFDYFRPTLNVLGTVGSSAEAAAYYAPWHTWIWGASWFLMPSFAVVVSVVVIAARGPALLRGLHGEPTPEMLRDAGLVALALACTFAVGGFLFMQTRHYNVVQIFYHENILLPFAFLMIGGAFAQGLSRLQSRRGMFAVAASGALLCLLPWVIAALGYVKLPLPATPQSDINSNWLILEAPRLLSGMVLEPLWIFIGGGILLACVLSRRWPLPLVATALFSMISVATIPGFNIDAGPFKPIVRDQSLIIYDIAHFIDDSRENRATAFWWDKDDAKLPLFVSLGEMYIWNPFAPPVITPDDRVVFVASSSNLRTVERAFTDDRHFKLLRIKTRHFQRDNLGIDVAIADVSAEQQPVAMSSVPKGLVVATFHQASIPLQAFSARPVAGPIFIQTPKGAWQYAAEARIPEGIRRLGVPAASLHVRLRVNGGSIGVGATTADGSTFLNREFYGPSASPRDVYIDIPRFSDAWQIVICNGDTTDSSSVVIYSVDVEYK